MSSGRTNQAEHWRKILGATLHMKAYKTAVRPYLRLYMYTLIRRPAHFGFLITAVMLLSSDARSEPLWRADTHISLRQCHTVQIILDAMVTKHYWRRNDAPVRGIEKFIGPKRTCDGPREISIAKKDKEKLDWFRIAFSAYDMCESEPDLEACQSGGTAQSVLEPLVLPPPDPALASKKNEPMSPAKCAAVTAHFETVLKEFTNISQNFHAAVLDLINGDGPMTCTRKVELKLSQDGDDEKAWKRLLALVADERLDSEGTYRASAERMHVAPAPQIQPK
jgi:hypothetical protein